MGRTVLGEAWPVGGRGPRVECASQATNNKQRRETDFGGTPKHRQVYHERLRAMFGCSRGGARAWQNLFNGTQYQFTESTGTYMNSVIMSEIGDK